ncbi:MAG TPA: energy transducer TonB [Polyangiaceae bacterium]|nr:energy transducer TonB [Polyangiaceae bacterium]
MQTQRAEQLASQRQIVADEFSGVDSSARLRSPAIPDFTPATPRAFSPGEISAIVLLSAVIHCGVAAAAFQHRGTQAHARRISKVEIEIARPPQIPKPVLNTPPPPPPPPKEQPRQPKPVAAPQPVAAPSPPPEAIEPVDTGSSLPSADDGELFAGRGGLGAAPPPPAPPPPVAPTPAPVVQAREGANYANNPRPAYPVRAKREGWQGTTVLRVLVQSNGKPGAVRIQKSSGRDLLDDAALEAVQKWTFVPATQGGAPVAGYVTVPIVFRLQ